MTDEQNDKRNLESWRDIPRFSANELTESWRDGYESGVADSADEIERLREALVDATTLLPPERWGLLKPRTTALIGVADD